MSGHGWVIPNPGGVKARCGGPALCETCQREAGDLAAGKMGMASNIAPIRPNATFQPPAKPDLPFESVLNWLRGGRKVTRKGWNGKGMYIYLIPGRDMHVGDSDETTPLIGVKAEGIAIEYAPRIDMQYADGRIGVWTPTIDDILADDWNLLM